jgi:hypothetical protein
VLIVKSKVRQIVNDANKRISSKAMEALENKVLNIVRSAIRLTGSHKTITATEILMSQGKADNDGQQ